MAPRNRPHLILRGNTSVERYRRRPRPVDAEVVEPPRDRHRHVRRLSDQIKRAEQISRGRRTRRLTTVAGSVDGMYVTFDGFPDGLLPETGLDPRRGRRHPELMSVHRVQTSDGTVEQAVVFVPDGTLGTFLKRFKAYEESLSGPAIRNADFVDRISEIRLAALHEFWTDPPDKFPVGSVPVWWEVWLRRRDGREVDRLREYANVSGVRLAGRMLGFADRTVVLVEASVDQLATAVEVLDDLAELRQPHELAEELAEEPAFEQRAWIDELALRTMPAADDSPRVCVIDTGVHRGHPLLDHSIAETDCHACDPAWGVNDHAGHGTEMAGLALYGDLGAALRSAGPVRLNHRLESVKVFPPRGDNPPELYGAISATAVSKAEIAAPARHRTFMLATTASQGRTQQAEKLVGAPTSWSAALDALAVGRMIDTADDGLVYLDDADDMAGRLFVVSAGNVDYRKLGPEDDYLERCDLEPVEDPGQAWNALTVGAYTQRDALAETPDWRGWRPVAARGELSPHSRTSVAFGRSWPAKPDVVLEGGNIARSPVGRRPDTPEGLQVLTTKAPLRDQRLLTVTCATSAATAQAAHLAAAVSAEYPQLWPETVRALMVHSAMWTEAMNRHFASPGTTRAQSVDLVRRRYGMGVPDLLRATRSAADALTLVLQERINPFRNEAMGDMHLHQLPWPAEILSALGEIDVQLRITLSYFIEPNPGRRGWRSRYNYASHGLRFDVRRAAESTSEFRERINALANDGVQRRSSPAKDTGRWTFGSRSRSRSSGSLETDIWSGPAADLAMRGAIAVYPTSGWWKEAKHRSSAEPTARYALVASIETPEQDVDIWTPVAQEIGVETAIEI